MALLSIKDLSFGFGGPLLFDGANLQVEPGERICLIGKNGEGKSTLLSLLSNEIEAPVGSVAKQQGLRISALSQRVPTDLSGNVFDQVAQGLGSNGDLLHRYHDLCEELETNTSEKKLAQLDRLQKELDAANAWELHTDVENVITRLSLPASAEVSTLSPGLKRRVLLAKALVSKPDILFLDEPTNHLDIANILWLEELLLRYESTLFFITHDRAFMKKLSTRIVELDRGKLTSWSCNYETYLERKAQAIHAESKEWERQDKKRAAEEQWIRKGIKARRTRNEGRVRALEKMRSERSERREHGSGVRATLQEGGRSGRLVVDAKNVNFSYGNQCLLKDFSIKVMRGDKIGLIGPNGVGKSTLIQILLGELEPQSGELKLGTNLEVAYFDQLQAQLDEDKTIVENVTDGTSFVEIGENKRHVIGYLQDFLFPAEQVNSKLETLSGGERNRLLLAKLFTKKANLLVLDEPTNDLDVDTLEMLEEMLVEYGGTVLIVSHDREFLDRVVTSSIVFEGDAKVREIVGGYEAWQKIQLKDKEEQSSSATKGKKKSKDGRKSEPSSEAASNSRLSFTERKELEELPEQIAKLEDQLAAIHATMAEPGHFQKHADEIKLCQSQLDDTQAKLNQLMDRWMDLEAKA